MVNYMNMKWSTYIWYVSDSGVSEPKRGFKGLLGFVNLRIILKGEHTYVRNVGMSVTSLAVHLKRLYLC